MIPFSRMLEYGNVVNRDYIVDIDFSRQNVGDTFIHDSTGRIYNTLYGSGAQVINDSSMGNVMYFPGTNSFYTPINSTLELNSIDFDLECVFKPLDARAYEVICETGNYSQDGTIIPGFSLTLNQFPSQYIQTFMCDSVQDYSRVLLDGVYTSDWEFIKMSVRSNSITISNSRTNVSNSYPRFNFGNGTHFSVGGSYVTAAYPYYFYGYIKSLRITKIL